MPLGLSKMLAELGSTPDQVAASLDAQGVKGVRNAARFLNVIVRYVQSRLSVDVLSVDVMKDGVVRVTFGTKKKDVEANLPEPVRDFLERFDHGAYPHLELPP